MDSLKECCICCEVYNEDTHRPLVLPCGHTLCKQCLNNIASEIQRTVVSHVQCPICKRNHTLNRNHLPTNYVVLDLLRTAGLIVQDQDSKSEVNKDKYETQEVKNEDISSNSDEKSNTTKKILTGVGIGVGAVATGAAAVLAAPVVLTGIGFTSAGVAAGSWAASMMSAAAAANGGGVLAGSMVALLQSAGAAGLSATAAAGVGAAGATVGAAAGTGIAVGINKLSGSKTDNPDTETKQCVDDTDDVGIKKPSGSKPDNTNTEIKQCVDDNEFEKIDKDDLNKMKEEEWLIRF